MRRAVFALMMTLFLLPGCGGERDADIYERWRQEAAGCRISFDGEITALAEREQTVYAVSVRREAGETELTLTAPENIAGVTLRCREGESELVYDGLILSLGGRAFDGRDPCGVIPAMLQALDSPRLLYTWREGEYLAAELPLGETGTLRLFFEPEGMTPQRMEAAENGQCVVFCNIKNWTMGET